MVEHLDQYPWSSHRNYMSNSAPDWLNLFMVDEAIKNTIGVDYQCLITNPIDRESWRPALSLTRFGTILIDEKLLRDEQEAQIQLKPFKKQALPVETVVDIVCRHLDTNSTEIFGPSRNRDISKKRVLIISYLIKYCDICMSAVARLCNRTAAPLGRQIKKIEGSLELIFNRVLLAEIDEELKKCIDKKYGVPG
jgi:hypothetical protein